MPELMNYEDFEEKLKNANEKRYELWYSGNRFALMATVTSANVHSYGYEAEDKKEREKIFDICPVMKLEMKELDFSRVFKSG